MNSYLQEVVSQAQAAQINALHYNSARAYPGEVMLHFSFAAVQGILTAAGQVAQLLWVNHGPQKPRQYEHLSDDDWDSLRKLAASRAKRLRKILRVTDASPIKSRAVRNSFEHFDARLDEAMLIGARRNEWRIIDRAMGPAGVKIVEGLEEAEYLRFIATDTLEVSILGQKVSTMELVDELTRLQEQAQKYLDAAWGRSGDAPVSIPGG